MNTRTIVLALASTCALALAAPSIQASAASGASVQGGGGAGNTGSSASPSGVVSGGANAQATGNGTGAGMATGGSASGNGSTGNLPGNTNATANTSAQTSTGGVSGTHIITNGAGLNTNASGDLVNSGSAVARTTGFNNGNGGTIINGIAVPPTPGASSRAGTVNQLNGTNYSFGSFQQLDTNHDGMVSPAEMSSSTYNAADANHDGFIDSTEWSQYSTYIGTPFKTRFGDFNRFATSGKRLDESHYATLINNSGYYKNFDTNGDGRVDEAEYLRGINHYKLNTPDAGVSGGATMSGMVVPTER